MWEKSLPVSTMSFLLPVKFRFNYRRILSQLCVLWLKSIKLEPTTNHNGTLLIIPITWVKERKQFPQLTQQIVVGCCSLSLTQKPKPRGKIVKIPQSRMNWGGEEKLIQVIHSNDKQLNLQLLCGENIYGALLLTGWCFFNINLNTLLLIIIIHY